MTKRPLLATVPLAVALAACGGATPSSETPAVSPGPLASMREAGVDRARFNQLALRLDAPVFWSVDENENDGESDSGSGVCDAEIDVRQ